MFGSVEDKIQNFYRRSPDIEIFSPLTPIIGCKRGNRCSHSTGNLCELFLHILHLILVDLGVSYFFWRPSGRDARPRSATIYPLYWEAWEAKQFLGHEFIGGGFSSRSQCRRVKQDNRKKNFLRETRIWSLKDDGTTNHHHHHRQCHQLQTALAQVLDELERNQKRKII